MDQEIFFFIFLLMFLASKKYSKGGADPPWFFILGPGFCPHPRRSTIYFTHSVEKAQLTRSMSKKGCSPDNSACEGFFGRLKNEMFYNRPWTGITINQFIKQLDEYIKWYAEKRIKLSLGGMSPLDYRRSLGLAV